MKDVIVRWVQTIGCTAFLGTMIATSTGCGALAAAANPKVAWAINDPAPMSVVVRRADVAEKTAQQVDRVMTDTPANDDSPWLQKVAPAKEDATQALGDLRKNNSLYAAGGPGQGARIVPAEVWAKSLASIEPKASATAPAAAAPNSAPASPASDVEEPVAKASTPETKNDKGAKKAGKPGSLAKHGTKGNRKRSKKAPLADKAPPPAEPVAAEPASAPAPAAEPVASKYPSLLSAIDKDLGAAWSEIMTKKKATGELKAQIAAEETALDVKGISDADKKAHKATIEGLEKKVDAMTKETEKLTDAFVPKAKAAAGKAPADVRDRFGAVLVNLRQAVDDAKTANGAAAVRYPLAATSLVDSAKQMASVYTADVIEEKTGTRPSMSGLKPGVSLEGGKVAITLNGLSQADMGKLSVSEVTSEVVTRTTKWVGRAMGLLGTISATSDMLSFEDDVLGALIDGFSANGWKAPAAATIPDAPVAGGPARSATPKS